MEEAEVFAAFGRRIASRRSGKGWSRVELARELGIPRDRLAKWERGDNGPPFPMLIRLRTVLGMTIDELITGERPAAKAMTEEEKRELAECVECLNRLLE